MYKVVSICKEQYCLKIDDVSIIDALLLLSKNNYSLTFNLKELKNKIKKKKFTIEYLISCLVELKKIYFRFLKNLDDLNSVEKSLVVESFFKDQDLDYIKSLKKEQKRLLKYVFRQFLPNLKVDVAIIDTNFGENYVSLRTNFENFKVVLNYLKKEIKNSHCNGDHNLNKKRKISASRKSNKPKEEKIKVKSETRGKSLIKNQSKRLKQTQNGYNSSDEQKNGKVQRKKQKATKKKTERVK